MGSRDRDQRDAALARVSELEKQLAASVARGEGLRSECVGASIRIEDLIRRLHAVEQQVRSRDAEIDELKTRLRHAERGDR